MNQTFRKGSIGAILDEYEIAICRVLRHILPLKYGVCRGFVVANDGTKAGFANDITKLISTNVNVPVIASGGAGTMQHFTEAFLKGKADAALAASVFHFSEINIKTLKQELRNNNINVRL